MVLAALGGLGQGWAGLRAQGLEGVGLGQGPEESVDCSPPPLSGLLAWALAAASYEEKTRGWVGKKGERRVGKEINKEDEAEKQIIKAKEGKVRPNGERGKEIR